MRYGTGVAVPHSVLLALAVLVALVAGCSADDSTSAPPEDRGSQVEYLLCTEPAGSWTDLTGEDPAWRDDQPSVGWTDQSGCAVRLDHVWHTFGDDHCGWEFVESISFGLPVGTPYTGEVADPPGQDWEPLFLFNTDGAVEGLPTGETVAAADVPATATDTGLRTVTGRSLRLAADRSALYDVQGETARVFVRITEDDYGCA
ncbi:MAG: hypothetical protein AAF531_19775 [Actinomycetota bacterium]